MQLAIYPSSTWPDKIVRGLELTFELFLHGQDQESKSATLESTWNPESIVSIRKRSVQTGTGAGHMNLLPSH